MSDSANRNNDDSMEFDALAELFLGDDAAAPGADPARIERREGIAGTIGISPGPEPGTHQPLKPAVDPLVIEALVMGHLPVRTGPWLSQYAATIARHEMRPVGMIRLAESEARVDVFGLDSRDRPDLCETLEEALAAATKRCRRWMIQVGDLDVPWLLRSSEVQSVTLLAGGNEAAVVDAYRTIKSLVSGTPDAARDETEEDQASEIPRVRLAIMGADRERAETVAARLRDASRAFLGREIELAAGLTEMGPTGALPIFRGRSSMGAADILDALRREPRPHAEAAPAPAAHAAPPLHPHPEPAEAEPPRQSDVEETRTVEAAPAPSTCRPRRGAWPGGLPLHVPGLTTLDIPYPDDPAVEFAIDEQARLHVLRYESGENGSGVSSLTAAGAWAAKNVALINLAIAPKGPIRLDASTSLHLFTSRPTTVRALIDADVRLHALAPVPRDRDWLALDLN